MTKEEFQQLLHKHLHGKTTPGEEKVIERFSHHFQNQYRKAVFSSEREKARIYLHLRKRIQIPSKPKFTGWRVAASLLLLLGLGFGFWYALQSWPNTLTTGTGERTQLILSDSSIIYLNAESSLKYPAEFDPQKRVVELQGEAYFEVNHDPKRPFLVKTGDVKTTVLGTSFNISAYAEDSVTAVSLVDGAVTVHNWHDSARLSPRQQAHFRAASGKFRVSDFNPDHVLAWRQGALHFQNTTFREMALTLKREYGTRLRFAEPAMKNHTISGSFEKPKIEVLLTAVTKVKKLDYRKTGEKEYLIYNPENHSKN